RNLRGFVLRTQMVGTARCAVRTSQRGVPTTKKPQDQRPCGLKFANTVSLNLRRLLAPPYDVQLGPCNKHAPSDRLAAGLSRLCRRRQRFAQPCRERNLPGPARP